ncbi:MAG: aminomethyl-transferring glycine dehydrogenase subunit GcvPA [Maioricimonas sp. JB049]
MSYLFNTPQQTEEMLAAIGVGAVDDLLEQVPESLRLDRELDLPAPKSELELEQHVRTLAGRNITASSRSCFLGGGAYDHFVPAVVDEVASRGEFYTAYTPYQAEASQGSLQAFFEFQTLICQLTGMDVSNASLYEGGTAVSEAAFMAMRVTNRHERVIVLGSVHPEFRQILQTYTDVLPCEVVEIPCQNGVADLNRVQECLDEKTACLIVQQPNFFGCLEDVRELSELARQVGALSVVSVDPISLGMLERPGNLGVDIVVAEGQPLGIPLQYGGPYLGILACRKEYVRKIPGRIVSLATDRNGKRCFVLGLQTREQHIRREKATSNICTNQGLLALRATVYMSLLGADGMKRVAELCVRKAHYAAEQLTALDGVELMFSQPFFKEFALRIENGVERFTDAAREAGFDIGPQLRQFDSLDQSVRSQGVLVAVTECRTRDEIDALRDAVRDF